VRADARVQKVLQHDVRRVLGANRPTSGSTAKGLGDSPRTEHRKPGLHQKDQSPAVQDPVNVCRFFGHRQPIRQLRNRRHRRVLKGHRCFFGLHKAKA